MKYKIKATLSDEKLLDIFMPGTSPEVGIRLPAGHSFFINALRDKKGRYIKGNQSGKINKGITRSVEFKARVSKFNATRKRSPEERLKQSLSKRGSQNPMYQSKLWIGKKHKLESRKKMSCTKKGIPLSQWSGFTEYKKYKHYRNTDYINWRRGVFERDNYTCRQCNKSNTFLHPHHIKSYTKYPALRYLLSNGKTLCVSCHKKKHKKRGK